MKISSCAVIFAEGSDSILAAAKRLGRQIEDLTLFDEVLVFNSTTLAMECKNFEAALESIKTLDDYPICFRAIKPWLVNHIFLETDKTYDVVLYIDAGCEVINNFVTRKKLQKLLKIAYKKGGLAEATPYTENQFTKKRLLNYFDLSSDERPHIQATWFMLKNNHENKRLIRNWIELSNPELGLWQNPDVSEQIEQSVEFIEHRRDQSLFSLLYKGSKMPTKKIYWEYQGRLGHLRGAAVPIHAIRNRTGLTQIHKHQNNNYVAIIGYLTNLAFRLMRQVLTLAKAFKYSANSK